MKNKILNFLIYGFGQSINILGPLLIVPFIIAICNEDGLGKVGVSFSLSLIFCCIIDYSSTIIGTKNTSINRDNVEILRNLFCDFFLTKLLILSILIALLIFGVYSIPYLQQEKTLFLLIIPLLIAQLFNINWILQGLEKFKLIAIFNVLSKGSYILLIF
ncbi:MAG: oligosaccharide flippase family protein, partial [Weeksellaceae bacterium]|nr:oligosaccharide flippase family protein [Weeksellaceae bacterium]